MKRRIKIFINGAINNVNSSVFKEVEDYLKQLGFIVTNPLKKLLQTKTSRETLFKNILGLRKAQYVFPIDEHEKIETCMVIDHIVTSLRIPQIDMVELQKIYQRNL